MISIGELNLLLDALNEVGINNVDTSNMDSKLYNEFASLNDNSLKFNDKTKLQVIYTSSIAKSLITEKVDEQFNSESNKDILQNHDAAKLNGIYKVEEISALCTLLSSMGDGSTLDNINVNNLKISSIKQFFNVDNGTASCSSYLVLSTVSINIHNLSISKPTSIYTTNTLKYKIISENEIVSLLNFVLTLNEDATVGSLSSITNNIDNTNISTITSSLDSKIILSISSEKILAQAENISIPKEIIKKDGVDLIDTNEIKVLLELCDSINGVDKVSDITGSNNLQDKLDSLLINDIANKIASSKILHATISNELTKYSMIIIPNTFVSHIDVYNSSDSATLVKIDEIVNLLTSLGGKDGVSPNATFGDLEDLSSSLEEVSISKIKGVIEDSSILHSSVSNILTTDYSGYITIPTTEFDSTIGIFNNNSIKIIKEGSLINLFDSLQLLVGDLIINQINNQLFDLVKIEKLKEHINTSDIIYATISEKLLDNNISIPNNTLSDMNVYNQSSSIKVIDKTEIINLFNVLAGQQGIMPNATINEISTIDDNIELLKFSKVIEYLNSSDIIYATVSCNITADNYTNYITIPESEFDNYLTVYESDARLLNKQSLINLFNAISNIDTTLSISNIDDSIFNDVTFADMTDYINQSAIIHASISDKIVEGDSIVIPVNVTQLTSIYNQSAEQYVIKVDELTNLFNVLTSINSDYKISEIDYIQDFINQIKINQINGYINQSSIVHASISNKIIENNELVILASDVDSVSNLKVESTGITTTETKIIKSSVDNQGALNLFFNELSQILVSDAKITNIINNANFIDNVTLDKISDTTDSSDIIRATVSDKVIDCELIIPNISSVVNMQSTCKNTNNLVIESSELANLFDALKVLNVTTITEANALDISKIDTSIFADKTKAQQVVKSYILRATITKNINFVLENGEKLSIYAFEEDVEIDVKDINGAKISIIKELELSNLLFSIGNYYKTSSSDGSKLTLKIDIIFLANLDDQLLKNMLESKIYTLTVSDILVKQLQEFNPYGTTPVYSTIKAYDITNHQFVENIHSCTSDNLYNFITSI